MPKKSLRGKASQKITTLKGAWSDLPGHVGNHHILAIGDVHGQDQILSEVLLEIEAQRHQNVERLLVFTGDLIDRGPSSLRSIELAMQAKQIASVDDVLILPGNHELMLLDGLASPMEKLSIWLDNGGETVLSEVDPAGKLLRLNDIADCLRANLNGDWLEAQCTGPTYFHICDLIFVHAGLDPLMNVEAFLGQSRSNVAHDRHWAWIREPFLSWGHGWNAEQTRVVVHGHTPPSRSSEGPSGFFNHADHVKEQQRLCLDAGAGYAPRIGWAEFFRGKYRINITFGGDL